jgi:hypothetical protein
MKTTRYCESPVDVQAERLRMTCSKKVLARVIQILPIRRRYKLKNKGHSAWFDLIRFYVINLLNCSINNKMLYSFTSKPHFGIFLESLVEKVSTQKIESEKRLFQHVASANTRRLFRTFDFDGLDGSLMQHRAVIAPIGKIHSKFRLVV